MALRIGVIKKRGGMGDGGELAGENMGCPDAKYCI